MDHDPTRIRTLAVDTRLEGRVRTGAVMHRLLFGLDYNRTRSDWVFAEAEMAPIDAFAPVYDRASSTTVDRLDGTSTTQKDSAWTGRVGLTYLFDSGLAPYAGYTTSFDPEIGIDASGKAYEPTTARQTEVGVKYQPPGSDAFVAVSVDLLVLGGLLLW